MTDYLQLPLPQSAWIIFILNWIGLFLSWIIFILDCFDLGFFYLKLDWIILILELV